MFSKILQLFIYFQQETSKKEICIYDKISDELHLIHVIKLDDITILIYEQTLLFFLFIHSVFLLFQLMKIFAILLIFVSAIYKKYMYHSSLIFMLDCISFNMHSFVYTYHSPFLSEVEQGQKERRNIY